MSTHRNACRSKRAAHVFVQVTVIITQYLNHDSTRAERCGIRKKKCPPPRSKSTALPCNTGGQGESESFSVGSRRGLLIGRGRTCKTDVRGFRLIGIRFRTDADERNNREQTRRVATSGANKTYKPSIYDLLTGVAGGCVHTPNDINGVPGVNLSSAVGEKIGKRIQNKINKYAYVCIFMCVSALMRVRFPPSISDRKYASTNPDININLIGCGRRYDRVFQLFERVSSHDVQREEE